MPIISSKTKSDFFPVQIKGWVRARWRSRWSGSHLYLSSVMTYRTNGQTGNGNMGSGNSITPSLLFSTNQNRGRLLFDQWVNWKKNHVYPVSTDQNWTPNYLNHHALFILTNQLHSLTEGAEWRHEWWRRKEGRREDTTTRDAFLIISPQGFAYLGRGEEDNR